MKRYLAAVLIMLSSGTIHSATLTFELGNAAGEVPCTMGSCFGESGIFPALFTNISSFNGLIVDGSTVQSASGSHSGSPNGTESPGIDNPWERFGATGMFFTDIPASKVGGVGNTVMLDMSGLAITWNGITLFRVEDEFDLTINPANMTCSGTCSDNETYTLTYQMALPGECHPLFDPSCFGAQYRFYDLTLRGVIIGNDISNVPLPPTSWLMLSGVIVLLRFRRHQNKVTFTYNH